MTIFNNFILNFILFNIGFFGIILNRQSLIIILISIELVLLSVNLNYLFFSVYLDDILGEVFSLIVLAVAAAESAIGLAIIVVFFKNRSTIEINKINLLAK